MYKAVTSVKANDDYTLLIGFGEEGVRVLDMRPYLDLGRFRELKSEDKFKDVRVSFDTIEWGNGLDLDPEFIYAKSKAADA